MVFVSKSSGVVIGYKHNLTCLFISLNMVLLTTWVLTFCPKNQVFLSLKSNSSFNGILYTLELTEKLSPFLLTRLFSGVYFPFKKFGASQYNVL